MFNKRPRHKGIRGFVEKHPLKAAAIGTAIVKAAHSKTAKAIAATAAVGTVGYLIYRKVHHRNGMESVKTRVGEGTQAMRSYFHGKLSHL